MDKLSVIDFWNRYSTGAIRFVEHPDLPLKINLNVFFDAYFGKLSYHYFNTVELNKINLTCKKCPHIDLPRADICDTHIGIIKGQIENFFNTDFDSKNSIISNECVIEFNEKN